MLMQRYVFPEMTETDYHLQRPSMLLLLLPLVPRRNPSTGGRHLRGRLHGRVDPKGRGQGSLREAGREGYEPHHGNGHAGLASVRHVLETWSSGHVSSVVRNGGEPYRRYLAAQGFSTRFTTAHRPMPLIVRALRCGPGGYHPL